jgi:FkbM family methyltransferase
MARLGHYYQARFRNRFGQLVQALSAYIPDGAVILDIGANHGKMTRPLARLHRGRVSVHAFEPLPYNHTLLGLVVRGLPNVSIHRTALSDRPGQISLYVPLRPSNRISPGSAHMGDRAHEHTFGTSTARRVTEVTIPTDTLDAFAGRASLNRVDFMKIDVEGAESLVLAGGSATLRTHRPAIFCEIADRCASLGKTPADTIGPLLDLGYRLYGFNERAARPTPMSAHDPRERDYLFLHPQRHPLPEA